VRLMKRMKRFLLGTTIVMLPVAIALMTPVSVAEGDLDGKAIFEAAKCNMCHSVPAAGIEAKMKSAEMKGPDITSATAGLDAEALGKFLRKQGPLNDQEHKKEFKGTDEELAALVEWLRTQPEG